MKLDYELAKTIGATHWSKINAPYYKIDHGKFFVYTERLGWEPSLISAEYFIKNIKLIPPKPQVRFEYEHITDLEIWDLKDMFDNGELYSKTSDGQYKKYTHSGLMIRHYLDYGVYRRIEKPFNWREEVLGYLKSKEDTHDSDFYRDLKNDFDLLSETDFDLIAGLSKIILSAKGEL